MSVMPPTVLSEYWGSVMQGPVVDVVMLLLLILFFGLQQRSRPQMYFRFWFVGWTFVFFSYFVWAMRVQTPGWEPLRYAVEFNFMLLGVLTFLLSLLAEEPGLRAKVQGGLAIGLACVLVLDAQKFVAVPKVVLVMTILLWQVTGVSVGSAVLPLRWPRTRRLVLAICVMCGSAMLVYVGLTQGRNLDNLALVEVLLCTAVLYGGSSARRSVAGGMGTLGLVGWAAFYVLNIALNDASPMHRVLLEFWSFPKYFVGFSMILRVFEDAMEEKAQLAEGFRELYEDFHTLYYSHPYPMWIYEPGTGRFLSANAAAAKSYGYTAEEFLGMTVRDLEAHCSEGVDHLFPAIKDGRRVCHRDKAGRVTWVHATERSTVFLGQQAQFLLARDITEKVKLNRELAYRAQHDALTGLPNRQLLTERLKACLDKSELEQRRVALLTIDVDHFKWINDTYGHPVGDECLKMVASRLNSKIRKVDTIARVGGEEFVAVVSGLSQAGDAEKVAASLLSVFATPMKVSRGELRVTVSIGVAVFPDDAMEAEDLWRLSDEALYRAKHGGRNRAMHAGARVLGFKELEAAS